MHPQIFLQFIPFIFFIVIALVIGSFIFKIFKNGGFKAALFGAPIQRTVGEVVSSRSSRLISVVVRVHVLGGESSDKAIGLELVAKSPASYQMMPVTLSQAAAKELIVLLESATTGV